MVADGKYKDMCQEKENGILPKISFKEQTCMAKKTVKLMPGVLNSKAKSSTSSSSPLVTHSNG
jgi:hypothetical protein